MLEELEEFVKGCEEQDLSQQADALVDLVYVALGTAIQMGLTYAWPTLWADVQRANMDKVRGVGKRGNLVDVIKPNGWVGPQTSIILESFGYDVTDDRTGVNLVDDPEYINAR